MKKHKKITTLYFNSFTGPPNPLHEQWYDFIVQAEDPDGDNLEYNWEVNTSIGPSLDFKPNESKISWYTPNKPGDYIMTVTVTDGKGGQATASLTITINRIAYDTKMPVVFSEGGYAAYGGSTENGSYIYAGDSSDNKFCLRF